MVPRNGRLVVAANYPLYKYEWYDHYSRDGWCDPETVSQPYLVKGVGYLFKEDKHYLYFTDNVVESTGQLKGIMAILKSALKKKTRIT